MGFLELLLLAVGVAMDAFAVSVCKGLSMKRAGVREGLICGLWFGGFQAVMPLIGFYLGRSFAGFISAVDHWVAFVLLAVIGINMLREALSSECDCENHDGDLSPKTMFVMAVATSIDALAVGISLAMAGNVNIFSAIGLIGATTCVFCIVGVKLGSVFGNRFERPSQIFGGGILILLGLKILLEHLNIL